MFREIKFLYRFPFVIYHSLSFSLSRFFSFSLSTSTFQISKFRYNFSNSFLFLSSLLLSLSLCIYQFFDICVVIWTEYWIHSKYSIEHVQKPIRPVHNFYLNASFDEKKNGIVFFFLCFDPSRYQNSTKFIDNEKDFFFIRFSLEALTNIHKNNMLLDVTKMFVN